MIRIRIGNILINSFKLNKVRTKYMENFKRYIYKAKGMPLNQVIKKVTRKFYSIMYHELRSIKVSKKSIKMEDKDFYNWHSELNFFFDHKNKTRFVEFLENVNEAGVIIERADKVSNHIFDLLGSGDVNLGKNIIWNQDFKSGFTWENKYYKKIRVVDLDNNADVKVPWELSRFQHIPILGQAYWLTADEKYANEFKDQINSWIELNPVEMSVNWTYAMEVAIRASNWIVGIYYFKGSDIDEEFWIKINQWLYMHGDFIFHNLEKGEINNNHYLSDLVGLVWLGLYFRESTNRKNKAQKWLDYGMTELEGEIKKQVYNDGFNYESSTSYHGLVTELLLYTSVLSNKNGCPFSTMFNAKLEQMSEVIMNITKPNGIIPQIGDMDSGRFILFTGYKCDEMRDFRYLLGVAGEFFDRDDFRFHSSNQLAAIWMLEDLKEIPSSSTTLKSSFFKDAGIYVYRRDLFYLIIRCGEHGTARKGGHTHNDQLSFELNVGGEDFIIDPGSYVYTSNILMRNQFRSTSSHNTLQFENEEQNNFISGEAFRLKEQTNSIVTKVKENEFVGEHFGFSTGKESIVHQRKFTISSDRLGIVDLLEGVDKKHKVNINFIINPLIKIKKTKNGFLLIGKKTSVAISISEGYNYIVNDAYFSKRYGTKEVCKKITIQCTLNKPKAIFSELNFNVENVK